ncbi:restriction endonuclease subunit S [Staphylococcus equorum]|uniref:restriction endonuclease subunit S n=1 Tax=Staphylococcus equorum TaxID=246432 RepID=UPI000D1CEA99|nr:restriction endonuclease subunit S [Staphylococcus equorum]PTE23954.1 restriction endonuclease subunit S [Staphylococcus equorum]
MTNEIVNVPELRFPEFNEEWDINIFGDVVTNKSSKYTPKKTEALIDIELDSIESNTGRLIKNYTSNDFSSQKNVFKQHQVLYSKLRPYLNKYYFPNFDGVCTSEIWILDSKYSSTLSNEFLYYFIQTNKFKEVTNKSSGSKMPRADWNLVGNMRFNITSLKEQQKIGQFFSKLDRQIELEEQKLEKLEEQKKGYMQKIFSQELRFKDESENDYPEWKERKFSELLSYSSNGVDKKINKNHDIAYMVNYMDVFKKTKLNTKNRDLLMEITATKIQKEKNNLKKGDILFTPSSETREDIAKSTVVFEDLDNTVYSYHLIRLRPLDSNIFSLKYSNYLSEQNFISKQFRRLAQGAQRYTLTKEYFENIKLNLPHIKEQEKIGDFFSKLDEVINKQSQKIDELKLRKQGFLQKMFV